MISRFTCFKSVLLVTCGLLMASFSFAQTSVGMYIGYAEGLGEFNRNLGERGIGGVGFNIGYKIPKIPFRAGAEIGWGNYFSRTKRLPYTNKNYPHSDADITMSNNLMNYGVFLRFEPLQNAVFMPYLEAKAGNSRFYSRWKAVDPYQNSNDDCEGWLEGNTVHSRTTAYYGFGGGMKIRLTKPREAQRSKNNGCCISSCAFSNGRNRLVLDLNVNYVTGGQVSYLVSDTWESGTSVMNPSPLEDPATHNHGSKSSKPFYTNHQYGSLFHSTTNRVLYQIGIVYEFR